MNKRLLAAIGVALVSLCSMPGIDASITRGQGSRTVLARAVDCGKADLLKAAQARTAALTPVERMAWREIQDRINTMSEGEEAKDFNAAMEYMADDLTLYELVEKDSDRHLKEIKSKVLTRQQVAEYKKQNLDSLYSTSPETHTYIESLSLKGNIATVTIYQHYVRVMRGGDGNPHEAITNVRHREEWIYTERGWLQKSIQEIERGATCMDGQPYNP